MMTILGPIPVRPEEAWHFTWLLLPFGVFLLLWGWKTRHKQRSNPPKNLAGFVLICLIMIAIGLWSIIRLF
jgi:hypothetical protein